MDCFNDVLTAFLDLDRVSCIAIYSGSESSRISSTMSSSVSKMNEGVTSLERHEGEELMTTFLFFGGELFL